MFKYIKKMLKHEPVLSKIQRYTDGIRNNVGWKYLLTNDNGGAVKIKNNRRSVAVDYIRKTYIYTTRKLGWFNLFGFSKKPPCLCEFKYCAVITWGKCNSLTGIRDMIKRLDISLQGVNTKEHNGKKFCVNCNRVIKQRTKTK